MRVLRSAAVFVVLALGAAACVFPAPPNPGVPVNTHQIPANIASGATCDPGLPDVSAQIQAWIDSLPNGATARLAPGRCYRTELPVMVRAKTNFTVDGNGSTLRAFTDGCQDQSNDGISYNNCTFLPPVNTHVVNWPRNRSRFYVRGNRNVTIRNIKLDGGHPHPGLRDDSYVAALEAQHAFDLGENNRGVTIDGVRADRVYGDYVYVADSHDVMVRNSVFGEDNGANSGNGRQGFTVVNGTNITFANNRVMNVRRSHIDIEPLSTGAVIRDIFIDNNTFGAARLGWFSNHPYGNANPVIENVFVRGNTLAGKPFDVSIGMGTVSPPNPNDPATYRRRNYQFIDNTSNQSGGSPQGALMMIVGVDGVVVRGNKTRVQPGRVPRMALVEIKQSRAIQVIDNQTLGAEQTGRYATSASGAALLNAAVCERGNTVGNPLVARPDPSIPVCL
ncbi:MAG: right-handed parallel beta-helix repeat-containing protein [Acidimicrobiia bacterium]